MNYSDYFMAKTHTFWGLKTMDPFVPFDEFLQNNYKDLKELLNNKQIVVFDADGKEIDLAVVEKHIIDFYEKMENKLNVDALNPKNKQIYSQKTQKIIEIIKLIDGEKKDLVAHKDNLIITLEECDDENVKVLLKEGIEQDNVKIEKLDSKRTSLLLRINKQLKN